MNSSIAAIRQLAASRRSEITMYRYQRDADMCRAEADALDEYAAVREAQETATWQPIETAPRDGTNVLVFDANWCGRGSRITVSRLISWANKEQPSMPLALRCAWEGVSVATHWMPLPAPPHAGEEHP